MYRRETIKINTHNYQYQITMLKNQIAAARKKLESAWEATGATDSSVLAAGDEFDALINEYQRLVKDDLK
ncbi:MAG: aspartyl-phosphate phosphatase Spo0E family protein [Firmicutes bacterium]|nr:aspartyl-phosphate phosphatase Spo0E family protein [Bacillota bacterium]